MTEPVELARLRSWLRAAKGRHTFAALARRADAGKLPVSVCTLRRALDGRLPSPRTVQAFARAAGADEEEGARVWAAAAAAVRPKPVRKPSAYVPGSDITTLTGLAAAMQKVRAAAGGPSLRRLVDSPDAGGRLSRGALHNALHARRLPSEELLAGFAAACGAGEETARALLAARARILAGPPTRPSLMYPCGVVEEVESRREQDAVVRHWIPDEEDLDWYERQLRDEEEAEQQQAEAWVDGLTDDELEELLRARNAAGVGQSSLRA
ncbi:MULTISPECIES: hypothetical protein [unclassified Streptomyces]|uniref:hypothetical protein n=1 Tax=unclassified Streptomyces TaxID=2593676 RepID=UPI0004C2AB61|nr:MULTISPECIES: hypothetical protein [unclassified Streptomyces]